MTISDAEVAPKHELAPLNSLAKRLAPTVSRDQACASGRARMRSAQRRARAPMVATLTANP